MKLSHQKSPLLARPGLIAAAAAFLLSTPSLIAQGGAGSSRGSGSTGTSGRQSPSDQSGQTGQQYGQPSGQAGQRDTSTTTARDRDTLHDRDSLQAGKLGWSDRRFVARSADSGTTEMGLAQLAAERATNPEVKTFAQQLVQEHTKVNAEIKTLARERNVELDHDDPKQDRTYRRLSNKSGGEFDREFVEQIIEMHQTSVRRFEHAARDANDPGVRSLAAQHVANLRQHLQEAQQLRQTLMPTGREQTRSETRTETRTGPSDTTGPSGSTGTTTGGSTGTPRNNP